MKQWDPKLLTVRAAREADLEVLESFTCSSGPAWEQEVEDQIQGPLPRRYLAQRGTQLDPRLLLCTGPDDEILAVASHLVETVPIDRDGEYLALRPTYIEVIAVALTARGTKVAVNKVRGTEISVGEFMFDNLITDVLQRPNRDPYIFARVDPRHEISLRFCDRVGLDLVRPNPHPRYVQRWGDLRLPTD